MTSFRWIYGLNFRRIIRRPSCHSGLAQDNRSLAQTPSPTCTPSLAGDALPRAQNSDLATSRPTFLVCHHERSEESAVACVARTFLSARFFSRRSSRLTDNRIFSLHHERSEGSTVACVATDIPVGALFFHDRAPDSPTIGVLLCHHERSEGSTVACLERAFLSARFFPRQSSRFTDNRFFALHHERSDGSTIACVATDIPGGAFFPDRAPDSPTIGFLLCHHERSEGSAFLGRSSWRPPFT